MSTDQDDNLDIAIIGMAGRFPGATNLEMYWNNLTSGKESISFFSDEELLQSGVSPSALQDANYVKAAPVLPDFDAFDAPFFGFSPREAQMMDPQHRLLLESAATAMEHAGYATDHYEYPVSVFAGSAMNTYLLFSGVSGRFVDEYLPTLIGNDKDFLATRISYKLNLKGPSVSVQSACSTSLVAIHLACQSLLNGESDLSLAGAVSVRVPHHVGHVHMPGSVFTADGHCRPFDAAASGTIFGSGVGVVVLKRLADAIADHDTIHAVIKGTAINNDGSSKVDYTAPSIESQSAAIEEALAVSGVDAETISYVEAHGTGTAIGDPIEVEALTRAFRTYTEKKGFCALGSVKSNVGHLDVAAGMAGLIKTVLALKHNVIPPTLHFQEPNPQINFEQTPFYVQDSLSPWHTTSGPRRAGVSSLGIGGTNAHVILEEAPELELPTSTSRRPYQLLAWSAKTEHALATMTHNLGAHLATNTNQDLVHAAYTLQTGRKTFKHRIFCVCEHAQEASRLLLDPSSESLRRGESLSDSRSLFFTFPGQGAQHINMGRDLYDKEPTFRMWVDQCLAIARPHLEQDLLALLFPDPDGAERASSLLKQTAYTQPALFIIEYALARLWMSWGIQPDGMIGHSIGEYVAACLADVFTLEEAIYLVAMRGRLMQAQPTGSMAAVSMAVEALEPYLNERVNVAAINSKELSVVSGDTPSIDALITTLEEQGITCRTLHTSHAFHSSMMEPASHAFLEHVRSLSLRAPSIPFVSNVTGSWIEAQSATDPSYWARHIVAPVRFEEGLQALLRDNSSILLEVGPGRTLTSLTRMHPSRSKTHLAVHSLPHPKSEDPPLRSMLQCLGELWMAGRPVDWQAFHGENTPKRIPLPTYPFKRDTHWFASKTSATALVAPSTIQPEQLISQSAPSASTHGCYVPSWSRLPTPVAAMPTEDGKKPRHWLIFANTSAFATQFIDQARRSGQSVTLIYPGKKFTCSRDGHYSLSPDNPDHYKQLIASLQARKVTPDTVAHLWTVEDLPDRPQKRQSKDPLDVKLHLGFYSLLYLVHAWHEHTFFHATQLGVVTQHAENVQGTESLQPLKATLKAFCGVLTKEYPSISSFTLDIDLSTPPDQQAHYAWREFIAPRLHQVMAHRGLYRWVPTLEPALLHDPSSHNQPEISIRQRIKQRGVYLITGGLGGIGLEIARYLAQHYQARLVLIGRSSMPSPDEWAQVLEDPSVDERIRSKIKVLQHLESTGASVKMLRGDVTNRSQMLQVKKEVLSSFNDINGIIHAAGIIDDTLIHDKTIESAQHVLAPKIQGTHVLHDVFDLGKIDFTMLCSSINAYNTPAGQVDYAAANAFLDAFAHEQSQHGACTISINWPGWRDAGMLAEKAKTHGDQPWLKRELARSIASEDAVNLFERIVSHPYPQVVVSKENPLSPAHSDQAPLVKQAIRAEHSIAPAHTNGHAHANGSLVDRLLAVWQDVLGIDDLTPEDDFFEMGGHSLLAVTLFKKMEQEVGTMPLPISALIKAPTLKTFAPLLTIHEAEETWSPVVLIQQGTSKVPIFCIHGAGGNILIYRDLAKALGPDQTVYGIEAQGLDGTQEILTSIQEMAALYQDAIQRIHPGGPYILIGYCMGGTIALEIAQQLRSHDADVAFLALLETYNWMHMEQDSAWKNGRFFMQKVIFHMRNMLLLPSTDKRLFFEAKFKELKRRLRVWSDQFKTATPGEPSSAQTAHGKTLTKIWEQNDEAALHYKPAYYPGTIHHYLPLQEYAAYKKPGMNFDGIAASVETTKLPVYPAGMLIKPFVSQLAQELGKHIYPITQQPGSSKVEPLPTDHVPSI